MPTVLIGGDCATTSTLALAAGWPENEPSDPSRDVIVVEADPTGGSLAAWLDTPLSPSLSSLVTSLRQGASTGATRAKQETTIDAMTRLSASGVRFIPAPFRSREARSAVAEADSSLFELLAGTDRTCALVDVGRLDAWRPPAAARSAELCVVVHRQDSSSAAAATVRLERLAETVAAWREGGLAVAVAVIGDEPFSLEEIIEFAAPDRPSWKLALDPLSAAVLAGRTGVSARRLGRLPLIRSAARMASALNDLTSRPVLDPPHAAAGPRSERAEVR